VNAWFYAVLQAAMGASSPIPRVRLWHLRWQSAKQAAAGAQVRRLLDGMAAQAREHREWLSGGGGAWDGISAACGKGRLDALATRLGMSATDGSPRDVILAGLSTVATYNTTWDMLLGSAAGMARKNFLAIRNVEDAVNRIVRDAFQQASYYYRGLSLVELESIRSGKILPGPVYSFVSLSADLKAAIDFAFTMGIPPNFPRVVLAIDARAARALGAIPAVYSLASDVLDLRPGAESVHRTFQIRYADEIQVYFSPQWPSGSAAMARSIITVLEPPPGTTRLAKELGVPCVPYRAIFPAEAGSA